MFAWLKDWLDEKPASPRTAKQATGDGGERLAAEFLQREHGFKIIARNWRSPRDRRDEIDLICRDGEALVFVEVKTRAGHALVQGYEAVTKQKKDILRRAATDYLRALAPANRPHTFRFDIVEVATRTSGAPDVRHFANVPLFPKYFQA